MMHAPGHALVVEDQTPVRRGLCALVRKVFPELVVDDAANLRTALAALGGSCSYRLALIDLGLPDGSGLEVIQLAREKHPEALLVVTTIYDDDDHLFGALAAGADGYVLKEQPVAQLEQHLQRAAEGVVPLSPSIARRMLQHFRKQGGVPAPSGAAVSNVAASEPSGLRAQAALTVREGDVLALIGRGFRVAEVAGYLGITENTVAGYVKDLYRKLNISSRAEAALEASRRGLV